MPIIDVNVNVPEPTVLEAGEARVRILAAEPKTSQKGRDMISVVLEIVGADQPNLQQIYHYVLLPADSDDAAAVYKRQLQLKRFCECFDYDPSGGFNTDELVGLEGNVLLDVEEDEEYGMKNRVKRFLKA